MNKLTMTLMLLGAILASGAAPRLSVASGLSASKKLRVPNQIPLHAYAFDLKDVRLLDGPFAHAMELDKKYLLSFDVDRLLYDFRVNAGMSVDARPLGGWERPDCEVRGHFTGHYMSACALMYASTGDERLKQNGTAVVAGLAECQARLSTGYLSAYPESFIDRVEQRKPVWAPYYTLHKILAGLLDMYVHCDNQQALDVCQKFADWVVERNGRLSDKQMQAMLDTEHGGMNEVLANLYGLTGEVKYLKTALRFNHMAVIGPASHRRDTLTGLHANTQIPKFIGTTRLYELTGDDSLKTASLFFWKTVAHERSYVIGGNSDGEHFSPKETLSRAFGPSTTETCNTYNMLKLTRHLFCWDPRREYADYYERALYNHILASQNPESGMMCYYVPLRSGSHKTYNTPMDSFWCCTGTGVENHAKYGDSIYFHDGTSRLIVNLFIASELNWAGCGLTVRQVTDFPKSPSSRLEFTCAKPLELSVSIRQPTWTTSDFQVRVNGQPAGTTTDHDGYATVRRVWKTGDTIDVSMPMPLNIESFRDNSRRFAIRRGPLVLCAPVIRSEPPFPVVVGNPEDVLGALELVAGKASTFTGSAKVFRTVTGNNGKGVTLSPFYKMHGEHNYVVYWDALTESQWQARQVEFAAEQARLKELAERTVDLVKPQDEKNEKAHHLQGEKMAVGPFSDRHWRHATNGGWFSWQLKVLPDCAQELQVLYWGSDGGSRTFDVLIDGEKIATQQLQNKRPGKFFTQVYALRDELLGGKKQITVRFQSHAGTTAGGVFELRVVKKK